VEEALEDELEHEYLRYVRGKKAKKERDLTDKELQNMDQNEVSTLEGRTLTAKQARKAKSSEGRLSRRDEDDQGAIRILNGKIAPDEDLDAYVKMLSAEGDGDSEEEEFFGDDDEDELEDEAVVEDARPQKKARSIVTKDILPPASRAGRWFANPIFKETVFGADGEDDAEEDHDDIEEERPAKKGKGRDMTTVAAAVLHEMPKTEKEIRKEKRKKETLRQLKKLNKNGIDDEEKRLGSFEVAPAEGDDNDYDEHLDEKTKAQRVLISQGMGKRVRDEGGVVEIVPATESGLKVHDSRSYDSDNENYDAHDKATTLALGTMMLRGSKKKALVDASYNRYSWNDPKDLPSWFMDDEMRHNKPQLPVPAALMEQIKSKFQTTGTKDIKKVAEARMRKRKRATNQLKAAKKQANSVADNSEMSDKQKIKAIARAMKSTKGQGINPSKVYVVTKKVNGASSGSKGAGTGKLKFVDSRMKKDKRATRAANKRQKKGGKGRK
jgi:AdoMet-dependent rRNA methyltransferase SPB1